LVKPVVAEDCSCKAHFEGGGGGKKLCGKNPFFSISLLRRLCKQSSGEKKEIIGTIYNFGEIQDNLYTPVFISTGTCRG